jgi:hypothetical protein
MINVKKERKRDLIRNLLLDDLHFLLSLILSEIKSESTRNEKRSSMKMRFLMLTVITISVLFSLIHFLYVCVSMKLLSSHTLNKEMKEKMNTIVPSTKRSSSSSYRKRKRNA